MKIQSMLYMPLGEHVFLLYSSKPNDPAFNNKRKVSIALSPLMLLSLDVRSFLNSATLLGSELNRILEALLFKRLSEISDASHSQRLIFHPGPVMASKFPPVINAHIGLLSAKGDGSRRLTRHDAKRERGCFPPLLLKAHQTPADYALAHV
jgi:hypothetical protein